jgi:hypothetical protein
VLHVVAHLRLRQALTVLQHVHQRLGTQQQQGTCSDVLLIRVE